MALAGLWFDGRTSAARRVAVQVQPGAAGPSLALQAADGESLVLAHKQVRWPETWSARRTPPKVIVDLGARGSLEIADAPAWQAAVAAAGHKGSVASRMQTRWSMFAGVFVVAVAALLAVYRWGTPWIATQLTREVPIAWEAELSAQVMRDLDTRWLKPTQLPPERQAALRARFNALTHAVSPDLQRYRSYQPRFVLQFRGGMPPNAFALPGGTIVMTDAIVKLADAQGLGDDALAGVLAHEIGHVVHRHATRLVVEQGVLNVGLGLALGDVSWLASVGGSMLTGLSYRRGHETEADCFAVALMNHAGASTTPMADLLMKVDQGAREGEQAGFSELFSSHPATGQRAVALKSGATSCR